MRTDYICSRCGGRDAETELELARHRAVMTAFILCWVLFVGLGAALFYGALHFGPSADPERWIRLGFVGGIAVALLSVVAALGFCVLNQPRRAFGCLFVLLAGVLLSAFCGVP